MNTVFNLRLPSDLRRKVETEAKDNHTSINQYLLYIITKTMAYNEAFTNINKKFKNINSDSWEEEFEKIPDIEPSDNDKL